MEDECRNNQTKENADDTIANIVEVGVRRVSLKEAVIEGKGNLQTGVSDSVGSGGHPSGERRDACDEDDQRGDRLHVRDEVDKGEEREQSADDAADGSKNAFAQCSTSAFERDEGTGDESGVNSKPIDPAIDNVADHRRECDLEREADMGRIRERVRHEQALRFGTLLGRACWLRQKKPVEDDGQANSIGHGYPNPKNLANQLFG